MKRPAGTGGEDLRKRMRESGMRMTRARAAVADALASATSPLAMGEIEAAVAAEDVPRSTIYRVVNDMAGAGLVHRYEFAEGFARFEVAESIREHHHHFICRRCRSVIEIEGLGDLERQLGRAEATLEAEEGLLIEGHRLDLFGLCAKCSAQRHKGRSR